MTVDAVVFDVLGTLVDQLSGIRTAITEATASSTTAREPDDDTTAALLDLWQAHVSGEQERILDGRRPYAPSHVIDAEAAALVAERAGLTDDAVVSRLARANERLDPWPDSDAGLARLAERQLVIGLSNADTRTLGRLDAHAGLRWHLALSAQAVSTYKPAAAAYRLAVDAVGLPTERILMVATHAWDLRGAQALGLRTAYVSRSGGDPPAPGDRFDLEARDLADLADRVAAP